MAKTANNKKGGAGKSPSGKPAQNKKAAARRADAKPTRAKSQQKPQPKAKARPAEKRGLTKFLRDVRVEMGKVTWPTRKDLAQSTLVVLVAVAIATAYTGVLDVIFDRAIAFVVDLLTS